MVDPQSFEYEYLLHWRSAMTLEQIDFLKKSNQIQVNLRGLEIRGLILSQYC